jgi:hypothetical protein
MLSNKQEDKKKREYHVTQPAGIKYDNNNKNYSVEYYKQ